MADKNQSLPTNSKIVLVHLTEEKIIDKHPLLLFTSSQIDEVLQIVDTRPMPFGPSYLLGLCPWRNRILPVIDIAKRLGFHSLEDGHERRYLVVRTIVDRGGGKELLRCVLKIPDKITTAPPPSSYSPVKNNLTDLEPFLTRGLFESEEELMIVPDLTSIFCYK